MSGLRSNACLVAMGDVLDEHEIEYKVERLGKHARVVFDVEGKTHAEVFSITPSDRRSMLNSAARVRRIIRESQKKEDNVKQDVAMFQPSMIRAVDDEPRIMDLDLADRLGFSQPKKIRELIRRNESELLRYGLLSRHGIKVPGKIGRPALDFWLNENQAGLVVMRSDAPRAADIREQMLMAFKAWRQLHKTGQEVAPHQEAAPAPVPQSSPSDDLLAGREAIDHLAGLLVAQMTPVFTEVLKTTLSDRIERHEDWLHKWLKVLPTQQYIDDARGAIIGALTNRIRESRPQLSSQRSSAPIDELDLHQVYSVCGVTKSIPRRAFLSNQVSKSLDAYCRQHRILTTSRTLLGRNANCWPREAVLAWYEETGRNLIDKHVTHFTPSESN